MDMESQMEKNCTIERIRILAEEKNRISEKIIPILPNENSEISGSYTDLMSAINNLIAKEARFLIEI